MSAGGKRIEELLVPAPGFRSAIVALKVAELTDFHAQIVRAVESLTPTQFAWQPAPGENTIGMLLTHIALAEVHLAQVGLRAERASHASDVLGINVEDDGMPLAPAGLPPAAIAGRGFAFFGELLAKALADARAACEPLEEAVPGELIRRPPRPDGSYWVINRHQVLHHMVEHAAQHLGQILLLKRHAPKS